MQPSNNLQMTSVTRAFSCMMVRLSTTFHSCTSLRSVMEKKTESSNASHESFFHSLYTLGMSEIWSRNSRPSPYSDTATLCPRHGAASKQVQWIGLERRRNNVVHHGGQDAVDARHVHRNVRDDGHN